MSTPLAVLPRVREQGPGYVVTVMVVNPDDLIFRGHYPGYPIYPGVCLVECVHQSVLAAFSGAGRRLDMAAVDSARFHHPAFPGSAVTARVDYLEENGELRCSGILSEKDVKLAAVRLRYRIGPAA